MITFSQVRAGDKLKVVGFQAGSRMYRHKLLAMGLLPGTSFRIKRVAPLGDPVEIETRGFELILRRNEAEQLNIEFSCDE